MGIDEIRPPIDVWRAAGVDHAEALLVSTWRSAPRRPGARFLLGEDGAIAGNVSAGCVEADLAIRLAEVLAGAPGSMVDYGVSDETAHGVGLACGGEIRVRLSRRLADDPVWPALVGCLDAREPAVLLTGLGPDGGRWLLDTGGEVLAADGSDLPPPAAARAAARDLGSVEGATLVGEMLVETILPARRLIVVGATPIGAALARLARAAAIDTVVVDPRPGYAVALADADVGLDDRWPGEVLAEHVPDVATAVAIVAHDERIDGEALSAALRSPARYVGLLGGGRTRRTRFAALRAAGIDEASIDRVRAPIGLDIGAETPSEVAVAILAQVVADWRGAG